MEVFDFMPYTYYTRMTVARQGSPIPIPISAPAPRAVNPHAKGVSLSFISRINTHAAIRSDLYMAGCTGIKL